MLQFAGRYGLEEGTDEMKDIAMSTVGSMAALVEVLAESAERARMEGHFDLMRTYQTQCAIVAGMYNSVLAIGLVIDAGSQGLSPRFMVAYDRLHRTGTFVLPSKLD